MQRDFTLARSLERHHKVSWRSLSDTSRHFDAQVEGVAPAGAVDEATEVANTVATVATGREVGATAGPPGSGPRQHTLFNSLAKIDIRIFALP